MKTVSMVMEKVKEIELKTCPLCKGKLKKVTETRRNIALAGYKCGKCDEIFFSSGEIVKYEILTGKRETVRTVGKVGNSIIIRIPSKLATEFGIRKGDLAYFEKKGHEVDIKILSK